MRKRFALSLVVVGLSLAQARAGSGTWLPDPVNNDWNPPANWYSNTVPGSLDAAMFEASNETDIVISEQSGASLLWFKPGAPAYHFTALPGGELGVQYGGILNESGLPVSFESAAGADGSGGAFYFYGGLPLQMTSFVTRPPQIAGGGGGSVWIFYEANAGSASFVNEGGIVPGTIGGETNFFAGESIPHGKAGTANIVNQAGTVSGATGGRTMFWSNSGAEKATIICEGASVNGALGGLTVFIDRSRADDATLVAESGSNGGSGGLIQFRNGTRGGDARIVLSGDGTLDISLATTRQLTIGSLEGEGLVFLGLKPLSIGSNNLSTTFAGIIGDSGLLIKVGAGTLTLSGASTYGGGTTVSEGSLIVSNSSGSATGTGSVQVDAGTLGGGGSIAGAVRVGTGRGEGAFLAPAAGTKRKTSLTIQDSLTMLADATYTYTFKAKGNQARTDEVMANKVKLNGASIALQGEGESALQTGLTLTLINNTGATPINGTFSNLPEGAIVNVSGNNLQATYQGGDGNDLTLTVVP
ncbi:MAG: autotransporter-associated beta strand repeat-containing protein [Verrucomicrobiota bacterium]|nr:autotransporter-associated beta strand repeat-containing protein [Verrucomicrobiota bacterium]